MPKTGGTWSGQGRAPMWTKGVRDRSSFLIGVAAEGKDTARNAPKMSAAKQAAAKKA
ncbi:H-NS family nucleoid-associated regulatory protein [Burkholderia pyrrocinia]|uniref:H-NS family nucleoid-associated regulatory protein n=1 Tax=Burkholderia pyrrocinia TaxID=60550 RepID=UPI003D76770D